MKEIEIVKNYEEIKLMALQSMNRSFLKLASKEFNSNQLMNSAKELSFKSKIERFMEDELQNFLFFLSEFKGLIPNEMYEIVKDEIEDGGYNLDSNVLTESVFNLTRGILGECEQHRIIYVVEVYKHIIEEVQAERQLELINEITDSKNNEIIRNCVIRQLCQMLGSNFIEEVGEEIIEYAVDDVDISSSFRENGIFSDDDVVFACRRAIIANLK